MAFSRLSMTCALALMVCAGPLAAQTINVGVWNPSFEAGFKPDRGDPLHYTVAYENPVPGWLYAGPNDVATSGGVISPVRVQEIAPHDGQACLWTNGGSFTQTVLDSIVVGSTYTLTVRVCSRDGGNPPWANVAYYVKLLVDDTEVGTASLPPLSISEWRVATVTATITDASMADKSLKIRLGAPGPQARFDSVSLVRTGTPGGTIKFPAAQPVDTFDYGLNCTDPVYPMCGCTGSNATMRQTWLIPSTLGLSGYHYSAGLTVEQSMGSGVLESDFTGVNDGCIKNQGFKGASPPLSLKFRSDRRDLNYIDLGAMASAIDPSKNAVNGTDEHPLVVVVAFTPNSESANSQWKSSCYVQLFSGTDVAPVAYVDAQSNQQLIRICRDDTTGYTADYPSSAIAFGFRGGENGGMSNPYGGATCSQGYLNAMWDMYRHMLYDGRRWIMLKGNVPYVGAPEIETSPTTIHAILRIRTLQFDLRIVDKNGNVTHHMPNIPRHTTARGPFQYLAVGSSTTTSTAIFVDNVSVAGDAFGTVPGGVLEYYGAVGACCKPDRTCEQMAPELCEAIEGAQYKGPNTLCGAGVGRCCADPMVDGDHDGDVDMTDFAMFQRCITTGNPAAVIPFECLCFDTNEDGAIDTLDFANFAGTTEIAGCVSGAGVPANADCDNDF